MKRLAGVLVTAVSLLLFAACAERALPASGPYSMDPGGGGTIAPGNRCQSWQNEWKAYYNGYFLTCRYYGPTYGWMWWY